MLVLCTARVSQSSTKEHAKHESKSKSKCQESVGRSQEAGTRRQESGVTRQEPGVRSQESGVRERCARLAGGHLTPDVCEA